MVAGRSGRRADRALFVCDGVFSSASLPSDTPDSIRAICYLAMPPWFLFLIIFASRLGLEFGGVVSDHGELDYLLQRKRGGALKLSTHSFWKCVKPAEKAELPVAKEPVPPELAHHIQAAAPAPTPTVAANDVLDRLVNWNGFISGKYERSRIEAITASPSRPRASAR